MDKIEIGTQLVVSGIGWLIVEDIDLETGLLWCIDQDGEDFEIHPMRVNRIVHDYDPF